jgi:sugar phosphate isomerase/epimerase
MRLGVVGMLPGELEAVTDDQLQAIKALRLTGAGISLPGAAMAKVNEADCEQIRHLFDEAQMDLVQCGLGYRGCLFDPDDSVRVDLITQIEQGLRVAKQLGAHACLIRTGSLSPNGSYSPSRANHEPECEVRLRESLRRIVATAEVVEQNVVIETHVLTLMNSPAKNAEVIAAVGSPRMGVVLDYVNHFQTLAQVYDSPTRLNHIFEMMGPISFIGHCKDIAVRDGFVVHLDETVPGEGELDLATALGLWHNLYPDGYMMLEHLPVDQYPLASRNVHHILEAAHIPVY